MGAVARYELLQRIGIGGMAEIYRARAIGREGSPIVCVKKILPHLSEDPEYRQMFMDEARVAFTLHHPNVVQVLDLGRIDDQLFLALEFVDGADLGEILARCRDRGLGLSGPTALHIALEVLKGLHYAHSRRSADGKPMAIVHRDVSPGNVLVSRKGEVKLGDFGIARAAVRAGRTVAGVVKGNALFMAPEQITGGEMTARTDVYGAGLLLLILLCGRHPYERETLPRLIDVGVTADVPDPSSLNPDVPKELDFIVARATELNPENRYPTAMDFGLAIEQFARSRGIALTADLTAQSVAPLLHPPIVDPPETAIARVHTYVGPIEPLEDDHGNRQALISEYKTYVGPITRVETYVGPLQRVDEDPSENARLPSGLLPAVPAPPPVAADILSSVTRTQVPQMQPAPTPRPRLSRLRAAVPLPPSLAHRPSSGAVLSREVPVDRDVPEWTQSTILGRHRQAVAAVAFGRPGEAVSAGLDQIVRVWEVAKTRERLSFRAHSAAVISLALTPDGARAITGSRDKTLRLWDLASGALVRSFSGHDGWVFGVAISADDQVVSGGQDRTLRLWTVSRPESLATLTGHRDAVVAVTLHPDGKRALSGSYDRTVRLWNLETRVQLKVFEAGDSVRTVAISPDGRTAISAGADSCLTRWDLESGAPLGKFLGHREPVVALAFSPDGRRVVSGSYDATARLWEIGSGRALAVLRGHTEPVTSLSFSPDGAQLLSGSGDGTIRLWTIPR